LAFVKTASLQFFEPFWIFVKIFALSLNWRIFLMIDNGFWYVKIQWGYFYILIFNAYD